MEIQSCIVVLMVFVVAAVSLVIEGNIMKMLSVRMHVASIAAIGRLTAVCISGYQ